MRTPARESEGGKPIKKKERKKEAEAEALRDTNSGKGNEREKAFSLGSLAIGDHRFLTASLSLPLLRFESLQRAGPKENS